MTKEFNAFGEEGSIGIEEIALEESQKITKEASNLEGLEEEVEVLEESSKDLTKETSSLKTLKEELTSSEAPKKDKERLLDLLDVIEEKQKEEELEREAYLQAKKIIEALFFAANDPISLVKIREIVDTVHPLKPRVLKKIVLEIQESYLKNKCVFRLEEIGGGYILRSNEEFSPYIDLLYKNRRTEKLSTPATEVLAIVAYRQPITRSQIDKIRGVDCSGTVYSLLERELIEVRGRLDAPGRPRLYKTSEKFLQYYGISDLSSLPEFPRLESEGRESLSESSESLKE